MNRCRERLSGAKKSQGTFDRGGGGTGADFQAEVEGERGLAIAAEGNG